MAQRSAADVKTELITSFGDYHSPIHWQIDLVEELVRAVAREERERCAALVERNAKSGDDARGREAALAIARTLRQSTDSATGAAQAGE